MASSEISLVFIFFLQLLKTLWVYFVAFVVQILDATISIDRFLFLVLTMLSISCVERIDLLSRPGPTVPSRRHSLIRINRTSNVWLAITLLGWQLVNGTCFLCCCCSSLHPRTCSNRLNKGCG